MTNRYETRCAFPYWIQLEKAGSANPISQPRCLSLQPNWMSENRLLLGDLPIGDLMLTATHDAGAYT